jgi:heterodisulfide reductase subunit B
MAELPIALRMVFRGFGIELLYTTEKCCWVRHWTVCRSPVLKLTLESVVEFLYVVFILLLFRDGATSLF